MTDNSNAPVTLWAQCTAHQNWQDPIATNIPVDHFVQYTRTDAITLQQAAKVLLEQLNWRDARNDGLGGVYLLYGGYALSKACLRAIAEQERET